MTYKFPGGVLVVRLSQRPNRVSRHANLTGDRAGYQIEVGAGLGYRASILVTSSSPRLALDPKHGSDRADDGSTRWLGRIDGEDLSPERRHASRVTNWLSVGLKRIGAGRTPRPSMVKSGRITDGRGVLPAASVITL